MNGSWDAYLASPADFAGADDIIKSTILEDFITLNCHYITTALVQNKEIKTNCCRKSPVQTITGQVWSVLLFFLVDICPFAGIPCITRSYIICDFTKSVKRPVIGQLLARKVLILGKNMGQTKELVKRKLSIIC